jgi:hypothetical protein
MGPLEREMATITNIKLDASERALVRLLSQHYGDRSLSLYLSHPRDHLVLRDAMERGFVSSDGELTPAGYAYWQRHE